MLGERESDGGSDGGETTAVAVVSEEVEVLLARAEGGWRWRLQVTVPELPMMLVGTAFRERMVEKASERGDVEVVTGGAFGGGGDEC